MTTLATALWTAAWACLLWPLVAIARDWGVTAVLASASDIPTKTLNAAQTIMRHTLHDLLEQEKKNA